MQCGLVDVINSEFTIIISKHVSLFKNDEKVEPDIFEDFLRT